MFEKMHEKFNKVEGEISKAVDVFTKTIEKLEGHNTKLVNMSNECAEKVEYYNGVNETIVEKMKHNQTIIDKIKKIVD